MNLTQSIKERALELGFSLVGVTTCDPVAHEDVFQAWLADGRHGEMSYLDTPRSVACRAHPDRIMPECRSVLVLGARYPAPPTLYHDQISSSLPQGYIAAYAGGKDYHDVLPEQMRALVKFIELQVGHPVTNRWYTDTGPILERELAQRAGLGWIGKNTCLINPDKGSYFLLAEILLGHELEPDQPFIHDRCGNCQRCIDACPTGCILPDRTLDARRCISYLTIELKGPVPLELRLSMDRWVFGCDVCQQVCPWNRFAASGSAPIFDESMSLLTRDLLQEIELTSASFNQKYRHSPLRRARRGGYLRNVAVALGNSHNPAATIPLTYALTGDPEPLVRGHAAWGLGQIGDQFARRSLEQAAGIETDPQVKSEIQTALANL